MAMAGCLHGHALFPCSIRPWARIPDRPDDSASSFIKSAEALDNSSI
jgi:hypothetical protein